MSRIQVLEDLIEDEQVSTVVEVQAVFEDEILEPLRSDHPEYIDYIDPS